MSRLRTLAIALGALFFTAVMAPITYEAWVTRHVNAYVAWEQLRLLEGVEVAADGHSGAEACAGLARFDDVFRFSPALLDDYLATIDDPAVWSPLPLEHFSRDVGDYRYAPGALSWAPVGPGDGARLPAWMPRGLVSSLHGRGREWHYRDVKRGLRLCFALMERDDHLLVVPCEEGDATAVGFVMGLLDLDTRLLFANVRLYGKPVDCLPPLIAVLPYWVRGDDPTLGLTGLARWRRHRELQQSMFK